MTLGEQGLALIRGFESFSALPYPCAGGYWTIGYGAIWGPDGRRVTPDTPPITTEVGARLLARDCQLALRAVARLIRVPLTQGQLNALVSFTFNLGSGALQASTLRAVVNREEHEEAPEQFLRWVFAGGRRLAGLVRRREAEVALYGR